MRYKKPESDLLDSLAVVTASEPEKERKRLRLETKQFSKELESA